jgi:predicted enzyme related to lactoylglutathione lyase
LNMPAVTGEATHSFSEGKIIWHELLTDTPDQTKVFYSELFGWEFEDLSLNAGLFSSVNYTLIRLDGQLIGGMIDQRRLKTQEDISQWVALLSVKDIDAAVATFSAQGGTVFAPPTDVAERGRMAVVADPQGALIGLLQTKAGDPLDQQEVAMGSFLWDELWTADVSKASAFYTRLAPYTFEDRGEYRVLKTAERARAGMMSNPVEGLAPIWVNYLRVENAATLDAIVAKVDALGGAVLLAPQDRAIGGRVALIAGPSGAGIALQTWPDKLSASDEH